MVSEDDLSSIYGKEYHQFNRYINNPEERMLKDWQAKAIKQSLPDITTALDAGCSSGELVRAFRNIGVEAYGFDISKDLIDIVCTEAKDFVKIGKLTSIPYDTTFDVVTAIDLFEHIPQQLVDQAIEQVYLRSNKYLVTLISNNPQYAGHVTLHESRWWIRKFSGYFTPYRQLDLTGIPKTYSLHPDYPNELLKLWIKTK